MSRTVHYTIQSTVFGPITILWSRSDALTIKRILLPRSRGELHRTYSTATRATSEAIDALAHQIASFLEGKHVAFTSNLLDFSLCSPFQQAVLNAEAAIPYGRVSTYGRIAKHLGHPNASRAVGRALATNPFPLVIPCHRAIRANGELGGYQGGVTMKRRLLEMEGISFSDAGKVPLRNVYYA